jgi:HEAT repeat protein
MKIAALALVLPFSALLAANALAQWPPVTDGASRYDNGATRSSGGSGRSAGGTNSGPGDTVPGAGPARPPGTAGGGSGGRPESPKGGGGAAPGTGPGAGASGIGPSPMPSLPALTMTNDDSWYLWWEFNKAEFLRPNRLDLLSAPASGDDALSALQRYADALRTALGPALQDALREGDPRLRSAAAIAYGRTHGAAAIPRLVELLDDANVDVRHGALLGLGATGAEEAVALLLTVARDGTRDGLGRQRISPAAEAHAFVALALGRKRGFPAYVDTQLAVRVSGRTKAEREPIGCAAMIYQRLAPCPEFEALAVQLASDESEAPIVRCRAIEALAGSHSDKTLARLQGFLAGPRLDLRRSAALALGELADPDALAPLLAAYEQESESLTRGFLLTAIGRRGGEQAREFLLHALAGNPKSLHPWSALALGILGRKSPDPALAGALREAAERESNPQSRSAYWLAAGLLRDQESLPTLCKALAEASDPRNRMYAASALALLGGEDAHRVLRERLALDGSPLVRAAIAQALGCMGRGEDVEAIAATLETLNEPELQAMAATALGFHASFDALRKLNDIAGSRASASLRRAAAIEGAGMALGRFAPLALMDVARDSNYTIFNEWGQGLYRSTL